MTALWATVLSTAFLMGSIANAKSHHPSSLESHVVNVVDIYAAQERVDYLDTNSNFVGFSFEKLETSKRIAVFHADSSIDISIREYECKNTVCELSSAYPRCFYHAELGGFSISNFMTALRLGLEPLLLEGVSSESISMMKIWQSGGNIFGKVSFERSNQTANMAFVCKETSGFHCEESAFTLPNEP